MALVAVLRKERQGALHDIDLQLRLKAGQVSERGGERQGALHDTDLQLWLKAGQVREGGWGKGWGAELGGRK